MRRVENPARAVTRSYRSLLRDLEKQPSALGLFEAGEAARRLGEHALSESLFRRCLNAARSEGNKSTMAWGLWGLATLKRLSGDFDAAVGAYRGYWLYTTNPYDIQKKRDAFARYGFEEGLEILARSNS